MKKFNRILSLILCVMLVAATCLTGCSKKDENNTNNTPTETVTTTAPETTEAPATTDTPVDEPTEAPEVTEAPTDVTEPDDTVEPEVTEPEVTDPEITEAPVDDTALEVLAVGEGSTTFAFTCTDKDKNTTVFAVSTDKNTVGEALLDAGLIAGEDSEYGLYVKEVNGIVADWDIDGTYWAFYIDGEYAMTGVDSTEINPESVYTFIVE